MHEPQPIELSTPFGVVRGWRRMALRADAPRVLAVHGWLDNAASFLPLAPLLPDVELVAIDQIGHGQSDHLPLAADYTALTLTRAAVAAMDALEWRSATLLGHSLGAVVCSLVAAAVPQRIERFVAIEALGALTSAADQSTDRLREAFEMASKPRRPLRVFTELDEAIALRMHVNHLSEPVARLLVERGTREVEGGRVWSSDARLTQPTAFRMDEPQAQHLVEGITCPTLVVLADPPQSYFPDTLRRQRFRLLRNGQLQIVNGTHHLHMEQPSLIADFIRDFIGAKQSVLAP